MVYPHGKEHNEELNKIEKSIKNHRRWIQGALSEIASVLKMKKDIDYYNHLVVALEKRVELLERKNENNS